MAKKTLLSIIFLIVILQYGCMYPQSEKMKNAPPHEDQIKTVQQGIDKYQKDQGGMLPIHERDNDTQDYLQHPIDFNKMLPKYLNEIPQNSYEKGGYYQYIIMDVDEDPTVYVADLRISEVLKDLRIKLTASDQPLSLGKKVGANLYEIDYEAYGIDEPPMVDSPYSDEKLPVYMNGGNDFIVDYRIDLNKMYTPDELKQYKGEKINHLLYKELPILPIHSPDYTVDKTGEIVLKTSLNSKK